METTFFEKASENIQAAEMLFQSRMYDASANRAYYAALHAALAALKHAGIQLDRLRHDSIQARFNGELIHRRKVYPGRFKSYLPILQAVRDDADYKPKLLSQNTAKRQLNKARVFVDALRTEMNDVQ